MDVGLTAKIPDHVGAFDLPGIPDLVGADIVLTCVPGNVEPIDNSLLLYGIEGCVDVVSAKHGHHLFHG